MRKHTCSVSRRYGNNHADTGSSFRTRHANASDSPQATPILIPQLRIHEVRTIKPKQHPIMEHKRYYHFEGTLLPCFQAFPYKRFLREEEENQKSLYAV